VVVIVEKPSVNIAIAQSRLNGGEVHEAIIVPACPACFRLLSASGIPRPRLPVHELLSAAHSGLR
jgi:hypothetical protein